MLMRSTLAAFLLVGAAAAQTSAFPTPSYFRETFARTQTRVEIRDLVKLKDRVVDGKLALSLKSYLELVMANNTDIQLQLLTLETPKNAITRAMSTWDPTANASFSSTRSTSPSVTALSGANTSESLNQPANFSFNETLPTGMQYSVGYSASKGTTNSSFATLNPSLSSALNANFSQPLLRNRGAAVNRLNLMMARSRYGIAGSTLKSSLIQLVNSAENAYPYFLFLPTLRPCSGHPHDLVGHLHCRFPRFRLGVRRRVRPPSSCLAHRTLSGGRARTSPPPVPTSQPPTGERIEIAPYPAPTCERRCADAGWIACLHEKPSAYLLRSGCLDQIVAETVKKIGREGQQHYLRDESARGGSRLGISNSSRRGHACRAGTSGVGHSP